MKTCRMLLALAAAALLTAELPAQPPAARDGAPAATAPDGARRGGALERGGRRGGRGPQTPAPAAIAVRDRQPWTPRGFDGRKDGLPTIIVAGDSTAQTGDDAWHRGWAAPLIDYFDTSKTNIVNPSIGGRSFRSFTREGRWDDVVANIRPGDFVFIQFGHNDGGDVNNANGRPDLPGIGDETAEVMRRGQDGTSVTETVHTFGWYARKYVRDVKEKKGTPVLMTTTIYNRFGDDGAVRRAGGNMYRWLKQVADEEKVLWFDHGAAIGDTFQTLGPKGIRPFFQADGLHTTTYGAISDCEDFVAALKAAPELPLAQYLNEAGNAIPAWKPSDAAIAARKAALEQ